MQEELLNVFDNAFTLVLLLRDCGMLCQDLLHVVNRWRFKKTASDIFV